jgi:hypothetical protein
MMMRKIGFLIFIFILLANNVYAEYYKLTKKSYEGFKDEKAVVIYGVNWGRHWGCGDMANAQLISMTFSLIDPKSDSKGKDIVLKPPFSLSNKNVSRSYAIVVDPGKYELTGFDIKMTNLSKDIRHLKADKGDLIGNDNSDAGTFIVHPREVVYIGHFGLDCSGTPIFWRYYIEKDDFEEYVDQLKEKYKFLFNKEISYRLFETTKFGN